MLGGLLHSRQSVEQAGFLLLPERVASAAGKLGEGSRSDNSLVGDLVEDGRASPAQVLIGVRAETGRAQHGSICPAQAAGLALLLGAVGDEGPRRFEIGRNGEP